jgi:hypothetical protein
LQLLVVNFCVRVFAGFFAASFKHARSQSTNKNWHPLSHTATVTPTKNSSRVQRPRRPRKAASTAACCAPRGA